MRLKIIALCMLTISSTHLHAAAPKGFFNDNQRGWFWWEVEPEEPSEPEVIPQPIPEKPTTNPEKEPEEVKIGVQWLKENLPILRDKAVEAPTESNLKNYAYAQRLMMDYGSRFSTKMMEYMKSDLTLNEDNRRPTTAVRLSSFSLERDAVTESSMDKIKDKAHIWFFYRSDCPYCKKQIPILRMLKKQHGIDVLAVSMDGKVTEDLADFEVVFDRGLKMSRELNVNATPTLFLVGNNAEFRYPLTNGLESFDRLVDRLMLAGKETRLLSENEYQNTRNVREINTLKAQEKALKVDKTKLETDPQYLSEILKQRLLNNTQLQGGL